MVLLQSAVLGIVQGATEFLPISSSGHLVLIPYLFGWAEQPLVFDTTLHLGTAAALIVYFRKELIQITKALFSDLALKKVSIESYSENSKLALYIFVSSVPAGIVGVLAGDTIENKFRSAGAVAFFSFFGTVLMILAEYVYQKIKSGDFKKINFVNSAIVGAFQTLALLPGVSRSGSTISGGMLSKLTREEAARFSFLMSVPIVTAAGLFKLLSSYQLLSDISVADMLLGFITSFVVGIISIKFLLNYLKSKSLKIFIIYRLLLVLSLMILIFTY